MRRLLAAFLIVGISGCGGGGGSTPTSPTTPTTPTTPQANRAPIISSATVTPTFGIADITPFNFAAIASDPDGDTISYSWNAAGNTASSATPPPIIFRSPGGVGLATITVTDSKGASASSSVNFIVGSMSGHWVGTMPGFTLDYTFTQSSSGTLTATWTVTGAIVVTGNLDPASPNAINGAGHVTFRSKPTSAGFLDYTITGDMDNTGTRFNGSVTGSGLNGPVVLTKQ